MRCEAKAPTSCAKVGWLFDVNGVKFSAHGPGRTAVFPGGTYPLEAAPNSFEELTESKGAHFLRERVKSDSKVKPISSASFVYGRVSAARDASACVFSWEA